MPIAKRIKRRFTYQDYLSWPEEGRWEIIDGIAYNISPAPTVRHQRISRNLSGILYTQREKFRSCEFFEAPTDIVFDEFNVVQPDIFIVCDKDKITEDNIKGAPDLIIEITSPSTEVKDRREKLKLYEHFGVREYIILFSEREYLERYVLKKNRYNVPEILNWNEVLKIKSFDIEIKLWEYLKRKFHKNKGAL